jgi:citronellyl-CoA dehydrogenase
MLRYNYFTPEHEMFRSQIRKFVESELAPHADEWEKEGIFPRWVFEKMGQLGFFGANYPEEQGGSGGDYWYAVVRAEELVRSRSAGVTLSLLVQTDMSTPIIGHIGNKDQIDEFLAPALRGEKIGAICVTEPHAGSDVANIQTTARKDGDDYVINGQKMYITNGTRADFLTMAVRTNPDVPGYAGISFFTVPTNLKGYTIGKKLDKLGNRASDTAILHFDDVRVPKRYLLGEENHGFLHIMQNFQGERLIGSVGGVAGAQATLDGTIQYLRDRKAFGKPLTKFQTVAHKLAELQTNIDVARAYVYKVCEAFNNKEEVTQAVSQAKLFAGEMAVKNVDECLQLFGGAGYLEEYEIARAWRDTRLITIGGGTSQIMKEIISKMMGL